MIGKKIHHYEILGKLGEGGMGIVYKARDTRLDRIAALKFLTTYLTTSETGKSRFIREAKAIAALNHPNICTIYNVDEFEGRPFIVMEAVSGKTLRQMLKTDKPDVQSVIDYAIQITAALKEAHSRGIIHRDIKSDNIMVTEDNRIKVMDFGLAKFKESGTVTKTGKTVGTAAYMSPEQVRGEPVDERTDIWSLGIVLYEMLAGKLPFSEKYDHAVMYSILNEDPKSLSEIDDSIPAELEALVTRCIEKKPEDRFQTTDQLLNELNGIKRVAKSESEKKDGLRKSNHIAGFTKYRRPVAGGVAILSLFFLYIFFFFPEKAEPVEHDSITETESIRLMVLPFTNIGGDPNRQMFCDGLEETINSHLTQISRTNRNLWIVPAQVQEDVTISFAADGVRQNVRSPGEAYRTFGVNYVVTGSLQPIADSLRLALYLTDAKNHRQLDSDVIDVHADDVFTLQNKSVESVLNMLDLEFSPETKEAIRKVYTSDPAAFELYLQGVGNLKRYERIENIDAAINAFQAAVDIDPNYALAFAGLGESYWRKFDYTREPEWLEKAIENAETAYRLDADLMQVNITLGMINRATGDFEKAIENFRDVLAVDPTNADAYRELARVYESVGNTEEAEQTYKRAIRLKPENWAGYSALGAFYFRNNRFDEALEQFEKVTEITPDNHYGYTNIGVMYYALGETEKAQELLEHSLQLEETYHASSNLGTLYFYQGRYAEAARMYEKALDIHDGNYLVWGHLGSANYWMGEREKAREPFLRAIELANEEREINPNDPVVLIDLAGYLANVDRHEEARTYAEKALQMAPDDTWVMVSASTTFERIGERDKALYWIEEAIDRGYSQSEILNMPDLQDLRKDERFRKISERIPNESE
jgi:serine/threonine protein kinase/tetratricopeptide (TPR) repeat protein